MAPADVTREEAKYFGKHRLSRLTTSPRGYETHPDSFRKFRNGQRSPGSFRIQRQRTGRATMVARAVREYNRRESGINNNDGFTFSSCKHFYCALGVFFPSGGVYVRLCSPFHISFSLTLFPTLPPSQSCPPFHWDSAFPRRDRIPRDRTHAAAETYQKRSLGGRDSGTQGCYPRTASRVGGAFRIAAEEHGQRHDPFPCSVRGVVIDQPPT